MNEIDSNIYVIHKIYEHLRKKKKFLNQLHMRNGVKIYVNQMVSYM